MARAAVRGRLTWETASVLETVAETSRTSRLVLEVPGWAGHRAGQHVDVRLTAPDGYTAQRSYSIASAPEDSTLQLLVETLPDGEVSPYLTQELRAGDALEVRGPLGGWFVWSSDLAGPLQLIAGGSGVVPFLSMLEHHRASGSTEQARLLYSVRSLDDVIGKAELERTGRSVHVDLALTRSAPAHWTGPRGRLDGPALERLVLPARDRPRVFVCGPTGFVETVAGALTTLGHPADRIKTERFGASGGTREP